MGIRLDAIDADWIKRVTTEDEEPEEEVAKHYGPGPHKTGSPQSSHGGDRSLAVHALRSESRIDGYDGHLYINDKHIGVHAKGIVEHRDLPSVVFHVSPRADSIVEDGVIRANYEGGLGGQSGDRLSVSLTVDSEVAVGLKRDLEMMARLYQKHWDSKPAEYDSPEHQAWSDGVYRSFQEEAKRQGWEFDFAKQGTEPIRVGYGITDWGYQFFTARKRSHPDNAGKPWHEGSRLWSDPLFFGLDKWGPTLDPKNVAIFSVPKWSLDPKVLVTDFDTSSPIGLQEVRYWGDIELPGRVEKHGDEHDEKSHGNWADGQTPDEDARDEYGGGHSPSEDAPRLDDLLADDSWFPRDVLTHPHYYTFGDPQVVQESLETIYRVQGDPEAHVTIYRSAPPGTERINPGDWVALSRTYAEQHGAERDREYWDPDFEWEYEGGGKGKGRWRDYDPPRDWPVLEMVVHAREVRNGGSDLIEWGYFPEDVAKASPLWAQDFVRESDIEKHEDAQLLDLLRAWAADEQDVVLKGLTPEVELEALSRLWDRNDIVDPSLSDRFWYDAPMNNIVKHAWQGDPSGQTHSTGSTQDEHAGTGGAGADEDQGQFPDDQEPWDPQAFYTEVFQLPELPEGATHWIAAGRIDKFRKTVDKMSRKAVKLGVKEPFTVSEPLGFYSIVDTDGDIADRIVPHIPGMTSSEWLGREYSFVAVKVSGDKPEMDGDFELLARIEHSPAGLPNRNLVHTVPGSEEGAVPKKYRTAGPDCDVCQRKVWRKNTYIVRNKKTGEVAQTGKNDLKVYTGQTDIEDQARWMDEWIQNVGGRNVVDPESLLGDEPRFSPRDVLARTIASVRQDGFVKSKEVGATKDVVLASFRPPGRKEKPAVTHARNFTDRDMEKADEVLAWVRSIDDDAGDYLYNLKTVFSPELSAYGIDAKSFGLAVSAPTAHDREMGWAEERKKKQLREKQEAERRAKEGKFVGTVGERMRFEELTVTATDVGINQYDRPWRRTDFRDAEGNTIKTWYNGQGVDTVPIDIDPKLIEEGAKRTVERAQQDLDKYERDIATLPDRRKELAELGDMEPEPEKVLGPSERLLDSARRGISRALQGARYKVKDERLRQALIDAVESDDLYTFEGLWTEAGEPSINIYSQLKEWREPTNYSVDDPERGLFGGYTKEGRDILNRNFKRTSTTRTIAYLENLEKPTVPTLDEAITLERASLVDRGLGTRPWERGDTFSFNAKVKEHETDQKYRKGEKVTWIDRLTKLEFIRSEPATDALEKFEKMLTIAPDAHQRHDIIATP